MGSLNTVTLIGNLGRDMELRYTQGGTAVGNFSMATTESWKDKDTGDKKERTEWHKVVAWGRTAEALKDYLLKGKSVCVLGKLQTRKWTDKDGHDRYTTEVRADRIVLLGSPGGNGSRRQDEEQPERYDEAGGQPETAAALSDDDIPF